MLDLRGIVAALSSFLDRHGASITRSDEHAAALGGAFFMRTEFTPDTLLLSRTELARALYAGTLPPLPRRGRRRRSSRLGRSSSRVYGISHRDSVDDVTRVGRDIERTVLAKAVSWHPDERVLVNGAATIVF